MNASSRRLRAFAVLFVAAHVGCTADEPNPPAALGQLRDVDASESYVASVHGGSLLVTPLAGGDPIAVSDDDISNTIIRLEGNKLADGWFVGRSSVLVYSHGTGSGRTFELWKPGFDRSVAIGSDDEFGMFATSDGAYLAFFEGAVPNIRLQIVRTADCTSAGCAPRYTLGQGYTFDVSLAKGGRLLYFGDGDFAAYLLDIDSGVTTRELDDASSGAALSPDGSTWIWMDPSTKALYAKDLDTGAVEPWAAPTTPWTSRAAVPALEPIYSDHVVVVDSPDTNTLVEYVCSRASCMEISRSCLLSCPPSPENRFCVASIDANGAASSIVCQGLSPWGSVAVLDADGNPEFAWSSPNESLELTVDDGGSRYVGLRRSTTSATVDVVTGAMPPSYPAASTAVGSFASLSGRVEFVPGSSQFVFATSPYAPNGPEGYWWTGTSVHPLGLLATRDVGPLVLARAGHVYWSAPDGVRRLPVR